MMITTINNIKSFYRSHAFPVSLGALALVVYSLPHEGQPFLGIFIHVTSGALIVLALGIQMDTRWCRPANRHGGPTSCRAGVELRCQIRSPARPERSAPGFGFPKFG